MLTTLENNSVRGGRWHSLIDKVYKPANLHAAFRKVAANRGAAGVDHVTIEAFQRRLEQNVSTLEQQLRDGSFRPQAIRRTHIPKPGTTDTRPLGIPTVRDRTVQTALRHVLEPVLERHFAAHSYGFRPGLGCKDALRRVDGLIKAGYKYTVDVDLKSYFETIPHAALLADLRQHVSDNRLIGLVAQFLQAGIMEGLQHWTPIQGAPQGAVISPLLSNLYLNDLDHHMAQAGWELTRYADDIVIQCRTRADAETALAMVQAWTASRGLTLHPDKTRIVHVDEEGFDFLGYRFHQHCRFARKQSVRKLKDALRRHTRRTNGHSLKTIIQRVNRTLQGWYAYFKHSRRSTFSDLDPWIRMRLRSLLRKRSGRKGNGYGLDHWRYPNRFFAAHGLLDLTATYDRERRSSRRQTLNRRAGCGKYARPVRREGRPNSIGLPYPYRRQNRRSR